MTHSSVLHFSLLCCFAYMIVFVGISLWLLLTDVSSDGAYGSMSSSLIYIPGRDEAQVSVQ